MDNITVNEGQEAKFTLKLATIKPKPTIKWFRDDNELDVNDKEKYLYNEGDDLVELVIKEAKSTDSGMYHATLVNEAGEAATNKGNLIVNSKLYQFYIQYRTRSSSNLINILS